LDGESELKGKLKKQKIARGDFLLTPREKLEVFLECLNDGKFILIKQSLKKRVKTVDRKLQTISPT